MLPATPDCSRSTSICPRGHELSDMALNSSNNTVLITDENDDIVHVISLAGPHARYFRMHGQVYSTCPAGVAV